MKIIAIQAHMWMFDPKPASMSIAKFKAGLHDGSLFDECKPELNFDIKHVNIKGETVDEENRSYYLNENNEWVYKKYHPELDELCMYHPLYIKIGDYRLEGTVFVENDKTEIERGKQILINAFKNGYEKEIKKINIMLNAVCNRSKELRI